MIGQETQNSEFLFNIIAVMVYLGAVAYLGWLGYRRTRTAADYMLAGRKAHPLVMALSYGATFISTSAIVGFGGVAGLFGMSLLWLTFLNIFVGIFIAFVFLGPQTRRMGHLLDAHTFPEFLGRRFDSKGIQVLAGLIIFVFMPLYTAAVLIGGAEFAATQFGIPYEAALLVFAVIVAVYVFYGGLKGVMYTDALQGGIMFVGMLAFLVITYTRVGGVVEGHEHLSSLSDLVPSSLRSIGHEGWTAYPSFGFGAAKHDLWWIVTTTIVMGVGIGVMAQPQLVVRFMTVKSRQQLNRAAMIGGVFIIVMTGVAFTVGSLSNAYFSFHGRPFTGTVVKQIDETKQHAILKLARKDDSGKWVDIVDEKTKEPKIAPVVLDPEQPYLTGEAAADGKPIAQGRSISIVYAKGNPDQIIPTYIKAAMPGWFGTLFFLTLLAAAMSTVSSQFHTMGTGIGRDVFEQLTGAHEKSLIVTRIGIIVGIVVAVIISYVSGGSSAAVIARATAIFFGLCASTFLPAYVGGLFTRRITRAGAVVSMAGGFAMTAFWLLFIHAKSASAIGLVTWVTNGKDSLLAGYPNWPVVDPLVVSLPLSILLAIIVSAFTRPPDKAHLERCFASK